MASKKEKIGILLLIGGIVALHAGYFFIEPDSSEYDDCVFITIDYEKCADERATRNKIYNVWMIWSGLMVVVGLGLYLTTKDEASK